MIDPRRAAIDRPEDHIAIASLYLRFLDAWDRRDLSEVCDYFSAEAELIGADGRAARGGTAIRALLEQIFQVESSDSYAAVVTQTRKISFHVGVLHGCVAALRPGSPEVDPDSAVLQTLVTSSEYGSWLIESFQSTATSLRTNQSLLQALSAQAQSTPR